MEPDIDSQRSQEENLISILMVASRLGLLLFSQPARWVFSWEDEEPGSNQENQFGSKRRTLMVSPGLKERITAGGRRHRPRVLVDAIEEHI